VSSAYRRALWAVFVTAAFPALAGAAPFAYVSNKNSADVSVVDLASNSLVTTIPVVAVPIGVAVNAAGTRAYVANSMLIDGLSQISVIDTATNAVIRNVPAGYQAYGVALNPAGTRLYITNAMQDANSVSVMDTTTNTIVATIAVGYFPMGVTVNPAGTRVYVANNGSNTVSVIDTATNGVIGTVNVGIGARGIAINGAGTRVYVTNQNDNTVAVIDTSSLARIATVSVGNNPTGIAVQPDGTAVYVANEMSNTVSIIDTSTNAVVTTVPVASVPKGIAFDPSGARAYVVNYGANLLSAIDTARRTVVGSVAVGMSPFGFGQFIAPSYSSTPPPPDTAPPSASITSPTGGTVSGTVSVTVNASDNVGVARVDLLVNGQTIGSDTSTPYQFSWNSTSVANGTAQLKAVAYDAAGNSAPSAIVSVTVSNVTAPPPDTTPPTASIASPTGGTVSGVITISASASDNVGVTRVDLAVNGTVVASDSAAPWQFAWDSHGVADGAVQLKAIAYDAAGNSGASAPVTVTVGNASVPPPPAADTTPPIVSIVSPLGGQVSGIVNVSVNASDNVGVARVQLAVNSQVIATATSAPWQFSWDSRSTGNGSAQLKSIAYDAAGNSATSPVVSVTVHNTGPRSPKTATAVEYYNASLDHYFVSASDADIDALDSGRFAGWVRTGQSITVYAAGEPDGSRVCRFYLPPEYGDSHFFSASTEECAEVMARFPYFAYETPEAFRIVLPDNATGACPADTTPVYRVWNDRADTNHRYTTNRASRDQLVAKGYVPEGYGPDAVIMCSPQQ
jgi:YVTN family beta-propeller protein